MRIIPTAVHGLIDYPYGILLAVSPWLFGFDDGGPGTTVPAVLGVAVIVQSILTRYEVGLIRVIPMPVHLVLDVVVGAVLIVSPWVFGFASTVWLPHVVFGLIAVTTALVTRTKPQIQMAAT